MSVAASRHASLTRDAILFATGSIVGKAAGLVLLPVLTRAMSVDDLGRFDLLSTLGSALITILILGVDVAAVRTYFDLPPGRPRSDLLITWYAIGAILTIPIAVLMVAFRDVISTALFGSARLGLAVALVGVVLVAGTAQVIALGILRARGRSGQYGVVSAGGLALNAVLTIAILVFWRPDPIGAMLAIAISWAAAAALGLILLTEDLQGRPSIQLAGRLLGLGLPLAPAVAVVWFAEFAHRAILHAAGGATELAYLTVSLRIASVATLIVAAFQLAWQPRAYAAARDADALRGEMRSSGWMLAWVSIAAAVLGLLAGPIIELVAGKAYVPAEPVVGLALIAALGSALFVATSTPLLVERLTRRVSVAMTLGVAVAIASNALAAPALGAAGTSGSIAIGQFTAAALAFVSTPDARRALAVRSVMIIGAAGLTITAATLAPSDLGFPAGVIGSALIVALAVHAGVVRQSRSLARGWLDRIGGRPT